MTDATEQRAAPTRTADAAIGDDAADQTAEQTAEQTADAEASAEARTEQATTPTATTVDERGRTAAQPPGGAETAPPAGVADATGAAGQAANGTALFDAASTKDFQGRWQNIQVGFVDEPRGAVEQADQLVEAVLAKLQESFSRERDELERAWSGGREASTEDLRQAIRRYRSFFNRLLSI